MTKIEILKQRLTMYLEAEQSILNGAQAYKIGSRNLTRADLHEIRVMIDNLQSQIDAEELAMAGRGRRRTVAVVPQDW